MITKQLSVLLSVLLTLFLMTVFPAAASAAVTGTVTDTSGSPVIGAVVIFIDESIPRYQYNDETDSLGRYEVDLFPIGVEDVPPSTFTLGQNYPNPFNPTTTIPFTLETSSHVSMTVYNISGQRIAELASGEMAAGHHTVTWNGMDDRGAPVGAGIYFYMLLAGSFSETKKMLLLDGGGLTRANNAMNSGTYSAARNAKSSTFTVTISHESVVPYEESGVGVADADTRDFTVERKPLSITFVTIPGGTFAMGDMQNNGQYEHEIPVHSATLSSFEMSIYEVTQWQYQSEMGSNPSFYKSGDYYPVETVSWYDAVKFCNKLSDTAGLEHCYNENTWACDFSKSGFRLPTEAEWEYACRAGTETNFYTGNAYGNDGHVSVDLDRAGWYKYNSGYITHPVGEKAPNAFGLYDMHGNVWEWCNDWWDEYTSDSQTNPTGPAMGTRRVFRGGGWYNIARVCRSAYRWYALPDWKYDLGFRVVRRP